MPILDFIITGFCLIDDECKALPKLIRQRGFKLRKSGLGICGIKRLVFGENY